MQTATLAPRGAEPYRHRPRRLVAAIDRWLPQTTRHSLATVHALLGRGAALGLACCSHAAMATTYVVNTPFDPGPAGTTSLRQAVFQANGSNNNVVQFDAALNGSTVTLQGGEIAVTAPMYITGPGADKLTINANHLSRVFEVAPSSGTIAVTISGMTLTGGYNSVDVFTGGAIRAFETQLTLQHSRLTGNQSTSGGALGCQSSTCLLYDVVMDANTAQFRGGGFSILDGSATIIASVISGNTGHTGGGIDADDATVTLTDTRVRGNTASYSGGGIYFSTSFDAKNLMLNRASVTGNAAGNQAGAIGGGILFGGKSLYVTRSLISGNSANSIYNDGGGGIAIIRSPESANVDYSTIYGNYAIVDAGGILSTGTMLNVRNSTVAGNNSGGYGPGNAIKAAGSANTISGSIVANNFNRGGTSDLEGNFNSTYSLIKTPGAGILTLGLGNIVDGTDPQLGPLAANGGPTLTMLPAAASIVINHGDPATSGGTDQRGLPRVANGRADIGSVERQSPEDVIFRNGFDSS